MIKVMHRALSRLVRYAVAPLLFVPLRCSSSDSSTPAATGGATTGGGGSTSGGQSALGGTTATSGTGEWRSANLTWYESYPDPNSEECVKYNGCTWAGQFAALDGVQPESWVKANNIASVHSKDFDLYKLKTLRLRKGTAQIDVVVYDECADSDCDGCCTANSAETGFLIDLESYTADRFGVRDGIIEFRCVDCD